MYDGWLKFGGVELINADRLNAYVDAGLVPDGVEVKACAGDCDGLAEALGDSPYTSPAQDRPPWFDADDPDSLDFAGVVPLGFVGLSGSTRGHQMIELMGGGAIPTAQRASARTIGASALLVGRTSCSTEIGLSWLSSVLHQVCADSPACLGATLEMFTCCPAPVCDDMIGGSDPDAPLVGTVYPTTPAPPPDWLISGIVQSGTNFPVAQGLIVTNLCTNPSAESGTTTGWSSPSGTGLVVGTVAVSTAQAHSGTQSFKVTLPTVTGTDVCRVGFTYTGLTVGQRYTQVAYVWLAPSTSFGVRPSAAGGTGERVFSRGQWVRTTYSFVATATSHVVGFDTMPVSVGPITAGDVYYIDDVVLYAGYGINTKGFEDATVTGWAGQTVGGLAAPPTSVASSVDPLGTGPRVGSRSMLVTWAPDTGLPQNVLYPTTDLLAGRKYTYRGALYVPAGAPDVRLVAYSHQAAVLSYDGEVLADTPEGYWKLDETSGTTVADQVDGTHGHDLTNGGMPINQASLLPSGAGKSYTADGTATHWLSRSAVLWASSTTQLSGEAWIKPTGSLASYHCIMGLDSSGPRSFNFYVKDGHLMFHNISAGGAEYSGTATLVAGQTYHVAFTIGVPSGVLRLFINGVQDGPDIAVANPISPAGSATFSIGATLAGTVSANFPFTGGIDNVAFYKHALTPARIAAHYAAAPSTGPSAPEVWTRLAESALVTTRDAWVDVDLPYTAILDTGYVGVECPDPVTTMTCYTDEHYHDWEDGTHPAFSGDTPSTDYIGEFGWTGTPEASTSVWRFRQDPPASVVRAPIQPPTNEAIITWHVYALGAAPWQVQPVLVSSDGGTLLAAGPIETGTGPTDVVYHALPGPDTEWRPALRVGAPGAVIIRVTVEMRPTLGVADCVDPYRRTYNHVVCVDGPNVVEEIATDCDAKLLRVEWTWVAGDPWRYGTDETLLVGMNSDTGDYESLGPGLTAGLYPVGTPVDGIIGPTVCPVPSPVHCNTDPGCPVPVPPPLPPLLPDDCNPLPDNYTRTVLSIAEGVVPTNAEGAPTITLTSDLNVKLMVRLRLWQDTTPDLLAPAECDFIWEATIPYIAGNQTVTIDSVMQSASVTCSGLEVTDDPHLRGRFGGPFVFPVLECGKRYLLAVDVPTTYPKEFAPLYLEGHPQGHVTWGVDLALREG